MARINASSMYESRSNLSRSRSPRNFHGNPPMPTFNPKSPPMTRLCTVTDDLSGIRRSQENS